MVSSDTGNKRRWVAFGVIYLCIISWAATAQSMPPLVSLIMADLKISYAQAGLLMSFFALPGILIAIPIGRMADRYGQKLILAVSYALILTGQTAIALGNSLPVLYLGRVISGAGAMTMFILAPQMLAQWFPSHKLGVAMGIYNTGPPVGTILPLSLLALAGQTWGWRSAVWLSMSIPALAFIIFLLFFETPPGASKSIAVQQENLWQSIRNTGGSIWILGLSWLLFTCTVMSYFTFTPGLLKESGFSVAAAGNIAGSSLWLAPFVSPLVGYLIARVGHKKTMIIVASLALAVLMGLLPLGVRWILVFTLLFGIVQTFVPTPTLALVPEVVRPERLGLGYGIIVTCLNAGMIIGPAIVGWMRDITGQFVASYATIAVFALLVSVSLIRLHPAHVSAPKN